MTSTTTLSKSLTSREAARLLGVSEASIKRWADSGFLPALRTVGGHRRFRPEDVAVCRREGLPGRAQRSVHGPVKSHAQLRTKAALPRHKETTHMVYKSLVAGRSDETAAILVRLHLGGSNVAELADRILCPAMRLIGELWQRGELSIAQEHIATRTALDALSAVRTALQAGRSHGQTAICCAIEGDFHELPVRIAARTLEAGGWETVNLGTSTPFFALTEAVTRFTPRLVCVASTVLGELDRAVREFDELREATRRCGASIVFGGAGFATPDVRQRFSPDLYAQNFTQLERFAGLLSKDRPES